jgi:hypothetical protein
LAKYDERLWILQERLVKFLIRTLTGVLTVGILAFLLDGFHFGFTLSEAFPKFWAGLIAGLLLFLGNVLRHMSARPPPPLILVGKDKLGHSKANRDSRSPKVREQQSSGNPGVWP